MVSSGLFASAGFRGDAAGADARTNWGGEITVHRADDSDRNHRDYFPADWPSFLPQRSWALTVGGSARSAAGSAGAANHGDLYLEIQRMFEQGVGFAGGPVWNPATGGLGGQLTAFFTFFYLRTTIVDFQAVHQIGFMLKFPLTWVWPR